MSLMDKLKKNSKIKETMELENSVVCEVKDFIETDYPMMNLALSGDIHGGLTSGLTMIAGPSKHFKTSYALIMAQAFQKKYKDGVILFYDSEYGSPMDYFTSFGVDTNRVIHTPIMNIEELKFDLISQLDGIDKKDNVMILIDSVGNLASKKEIEDAQNEKSVADMTRAKQMKSLWRMATPYFKKFNIPCVAINHSYQTQEMFSKTVVSGGCLLAGTKIKLASGDTKNVEDFNVGEKVITLDGDKEVTAVWNPDTLEDGEPECYEVEFEDGYKVICSDEHKFLIDGEWVPAKDLKAGMQSEIL